MGKILGGHVVVKYLKEIEGIDAIFSLSGGHIDEIYDGSLEYNVKLIDVRHEQAAAMMAHSWSICTGKPGVCLVTAGPGFTNSITGLVNAKMENAPLVLISGAAAIRDRDMGALQDMGQTEMITSVVKWHATCHDIKRLPEYLESAFRHAVSGRPGPVFLELPPDVLAKKIEEDQLPAFTKGNIRYKTAPDPSDLNKAADLINNAKQPIIIGGSGCTGCEKELQEFVDKTGIPFMLLNSGRGTVSDEHPLSMADGGLMGAMAAGPMADLVITLGIRLNWTLMHGKGFPQAKVIRADIEPSEINRNRNADVGLVGDMDLILGGLNSLVQKTDRSDWCKTLKNAYLPMAQAEIDLRNTPSDPIHPARMVAQVREAIGNDALYFVDGGDTCYFGLTGLVATKGASVLGTSGGLFGCLGTGVPFGIGAKMAKPDKTVVVITGDGSFGLNAMEFDTAVRHNLPFVCVICNDQAWGMIKHGQEMIYGKDRVIGSELGVVHYEKVVEGLGGYGELVEKDEDIIPAVKRALASGKPSCINVITDPTIASPATLMFVGSLSME